MDIGVRGIIDLKIIRILIRLERLPQMKKVFLAIALLLSTSNTFANTTLENVTIKVIGYDKNIPDAIFIRTDKSRY
ncbi:hypothetical protein P4S72_28015 [Vibrio sp. PP-XX7]